MAQSPNDNKKDDYDAMVETNRRPSRAQLVRGTSDTCTYEKQSTKKQCGGDESNNDGPMLANIKEETKM